MNDRNDSPVNALNRYWNQSVGLRFTFLTFLFVLTMSALFVLTEVYLSYQQELRRLNAQISQIEESHIPAIVSSLWLTDYVTLTRQLEAIERFPHVRRVVVVNVEGDVFQTGDGAHSMDADGGRVLAHVRRNTEIEVGSMWLYVDENELRNAAVTPSIIFSVVGYFAMAVFIAGVVAVLFRKQVGQYIERLSVYAQESTEPEFDETFELHRRKPYDDELHGLVEAINTMRRSLIGHLRERDLLMREVHHRIKNDMGFVMAFLSLQANQSGSSEAAEALQEASQRVSVMANIYKNIFSGSSVQEVDLATVVHDVVRELHDKNVLPSETVAMEVARITVPVRYAVSFGIILNELLTNAAKYSVSDSAAAHIRVAVRAGETYTAELEVIDSGKGFPADVLNGERLGYGLTVVKALVEQYDGELTLSNESGATVVACV